MPLSGATQRPSDLFEGEGPSPSPTMTTADCAVPPTLTDLELLRRAAGHTLHAAALGSTAGLAMSRTHTLDGMPSSGSDSSSVRQPPQAGLSPWYPSALADTSYDSDGDPRTGQSSSSHPSSYPQPAAQSSGTANPYPPENPEDYGQGPTPSDEGANEPRYATGTEYTDQPAVARAAMPRYDSGYDIQSAYGAVAGGSGTSTAAPSYSALQQPAAMPPIPSTSQPTAGHYAAAGPYASAYYPSRPHYSPLAYMPRAVARPPLDPAKAAMVRDRIRTILLEDMRTSVYQVEVHRVTIARMQGTHRVNATKLLNAANITRGKRDGILKNEKDRDIVKQGTMPLKGQWVPLERARKLAAQFGLAQLMYPLLEDDLPEYISAIGSSDPRLIGSLHYGPTTTTAPMSHQPIAGPSSYTASAYPSSTDLPHSTLGSSTSSVHSYYEQYRQQAPSGSSIAGLQLPPGPGTSPYYPPPHSLTPYTATFPLPSPGTHVAARPDIGDRRKTYPMASDAMPSLLPGAYGQSYSDQTHSPSAMAEGASAQRDYFGATGSQAPQASYASSRPTTYGMQEPTSSHSSSFPGYESRSSDPYGHPAGVVLSRSASTDSEPMPANAPPPAHDSPEGSTGWPGPSSTSVPSTYAHHHYASQSNPEDEAQVGSIDPSRYPRSRTGTGDSADPSTQPYGTHPLATSNQNPGTEPPSAQWLPSGMLYNPSGAEPSS